MTPRASADSVLSKVKALIASELKLVDPTFRELIRAHIAHGLLLMGDKVLGEKDLNR